MTWQDGGAARRCIARCAARNRRTRPAVAVTWRSGAELLDERVGELRVASRCGRRARPPRTARVMPLPSVAASVGRTSAGTASSALTSCSTRSAVCAARTCANVRRPSRSASAAVSSADATMPPMMTKNTRPCIDVTEALHGAVSTLHVGAQHVAFVAHGLDELRIARIFVELLSNAAHLQVDRALERVRVASLREVEQLVATEHALGMLEEDLEQAKLRTRQHDDDALRIDEMPCGEVERPSRKAHARRRRRLEARWQRLGAPQDAADARQQLSRLERLGEIVVGAHFQADDAIDRLAARGQHDHRQVRARAQRAAQLQAVLAGHHEVEDDQVDARRVERCPHRRAVRRFRRAEAVARRGIPTAACESRDHRRRPESAAARSWRDYGRAAPGRPGTDVYRNVSACAADT